jgi:hypothetical protein
MKYILTIICLLSLAATCNNKTTTKANDKVETRSNTTAINGKWTMVSYSAFLPNIPSLSEGDIVWKIDPATKTIAVLMKNPERTNDMGFNTGSYPYEIKGDKMIINGRTYLYMIEEDGSLKLDSNTDPNMSKDAPVMRFKKL